MSASCSMAPDSLRSAIIGRLFSPLCSQLLLSWLITITGTSRSFARAFKDREISDISRSLKALAKDLEVPVIVISQLNRSCEQRGENKRPIIADLRESGAIEQDADIILFLYRDDYYKSKDAREGVAELNIAKQRNGPVKVIELAFIDKFTKFKNLSHLNEY